MTRANVFTPARLTELSDGVTQAARDAAKALEYGPVEADEHEPLPPRPLGDLLRAIPSPGITKTYVIRCDRFVKIGISVNPKARLEQMQTALPFKIELIAIIEGGREVERELHDIFKDHRERGEWFRYEGQLAAWIEEGCPL